MTPKVRGYNSAESITQACLKKLRDADPYTKLTPGVIEQYLPRYSYKTIRTAFKKVCGCTPIQYHEIVRYKQLKKDLGNLTPTKAPKTELANRFNYSSSKKLWEWEKKMEERIKLHPCVLAE